MADSVTIIFECAGGERHEVAARHGASLMETAVMNNVPGIEAECGGCCSCATCHVYCDRVSGIVGAAGEAERDMLELAAAECREASRLACQVCVTPALEGGVIGIPERQI